MIDTKTFYYDSYLAYKGRKKLTFEEAMYGVECSLSCVVNGEPHTIKVTKSDIKNDEELATVLREATAAFLGFSTSTTVPLAAV